MPRMVRGWFAPVLVFVLVSATGCAAGTANTGPQPIAAVVAEEPAPAGFVVVAPDRGFLGNEEVRRAYRELAGEHPAALVFLAGEGTRARLAAAVDGLAAGGAGRVVVLPLFVSSASPGLAQVRRLVASLDRPRVTVGRVFGDSYLAVEALADQLRAIEQPRGRRIVVVGYGADGEAARLAMERDYQRLGDAAARGLGFEAVRVVVVPAGLADDAGHQLAAALAGASQGGERAAIVPFHLGKKLDSMMSLSSLLRRNAPAGSEVVDSGVTPHPAVALWMRREANRHHVPADRAIGVVLLAHGADFEWNETMRKAVAPLEQRYLVEHAFCMADQPLVEAAVRRLERRGARWIVIVRVFGLASSFRAAVERMIGADVESPGERPHAAHGHGGHGRGHGGGARIRTAALVTTVGGLEADPRFADALLDRARALSRDPARETVILVAHGTGDDGANQHWIGLLEQIAAHMRRRGSRFRDIHVATWREDWPDKRTPWIARVRQWVAEASRDGGRVIVIPARTNAQGPERQYLAELAFEHGHGFAPHPLFTRWVASQIAEGVAQLRAGTPDTARIRGGHARNGGH